MEPDSPVLSVLARARETARTNQEVQVQRVAHLLQRDKGDVVRHLENVAGRIEIRMTRSFAIASYLLGELDSGHVPTVRSVFETGRQNHTATPESIAAVMRSRANREPTVFGPETEALREEDRPKYGFAYFHGTPNEPLPFGPICFLLNLDAPDLRQRITLTPVDSSIPGLAAEEVGTLDHPLNAFARSSDALRAAGLLAVGGPLPPESGIRDNAREGTPEAQVWRPLAVISSQVRVIIAEVVEASDPDLACLRTVAERQGISLRIRVVGAGEPQ
jgi:hypothetical protein